MYFSYSMDSGSSGSHDPVHHLQFPVTLTVFLPALHAEEGWTLLPHWSLPNLCLWVSFYLNCLVKKALADFKLFLNFSNVFLLSVSASSLFMSTAFKNGMFLLGRTEWGWDWRFVANLSMLGENIPSCHIQFHSELTSDPYIMVMTAGINAGNPVLVPVGLKLKNS